MDDEHERYSPMLQVESIGPDARTRSFFDGPDGRFLSTCLFCRGLVRFRQLVVYLAMTALSLLPVVPSAAETEQGDTIVITAEEIRTMQALKMADVLNHVPGIKAGNSSVSIHGSTKVKVFVDGRSINDPTSSHGAINWDLVSPDNVEKIEILKGKGGLTYGQDASGGVILVTTQNIQRLSGNLKVYGGNFDTQNYSAAVQATAGDIEIGLSGGYETTDGYTYNNDKQRCQAGLKLGYRTAGENRFTLSADYLEDKRGLTGMPGHPTPFSRKKSRNGAYALQAEFRHFTSETGYNTGYQHNTDISTGLDKTLEVAKFNQNVTTAFKTTDHGDLSCGAGFNYDQASGTGFTDQQEHAAALFAVQSLSWPGRPITLTAGLRGNYHSVFDSTVNPEIKLIYKKPAWRLTAAFSQTQNIPSFYQRYNETSSTRPNPDLVMERADNYSLALAATLHKTFSINFSLFYNRLTDRITYITGEDGIGQYQNFGEVRYTGGDLAMNWQVYKPLNIKTAYTYLDVKDRDTGLWVPCKARDTVSLDIYWQALDTFSLVISGKYASKVFRNKSNTQTVPDYMIADVRAEYGFQRFSLFSEITNIFNKTYYYADGLLAPPRTWVIGVNWRI